MSKRSQLKPLTDEQEAAIQKQIAIDIDAPDLTDAELAQAKPFASVFPDLALQIKRSRGRPKVESPKEAVTLRLSPQIIAHYKAMGKNWRTEMTKALEKAAL